MFWKARIRQYLRREKSEEVVRLLPRKEAQSVGARFIVAKSPDQPQRQHDSLPGPPLSDDL